MSELEGPSQIKTYIKQPGLVKAIQLKWKNWSDMCTLVGDVIDEANPGRSVPTYTDRCDEEGPYMEITIPTKAGKAKVAHGDYVIKRDDGLFSVVHPRIFEEVYQEIEIDTTIEKLKKQLDIATGSFRNIPIERCMDGSFGEDFKARFEHMMEDIKTVERNHEC